MLVGTADDIARARIQRKRLGAGWRQAGLLAAAARHALAHNLDRIGDDHRAARALARSLNEARPGTVDESGVESNIVLIPADGAPRVAARLREQGVLISVFGPTALRAVTHLDVTEADCADAGRLLAAALG